MDTSFQNVFTRGKHLQLPRACLLRDHLIGDTSTPCLKTREEILVGTAEDVPMLASKRTILQRDMSLKASWECYDDMLSSSSEIQGH